MIATTADTKLFLIRGAVKSRVFVFIFMMSVFTRCLSFEIDFYCFLKRNTCAALFEDFSFLVPDGSRTK